MSRKRAAVGSGGILLEGYSNLPGWANNGYLAGCVSHAPGFVAMPYLRPKTFGCEVNRIVAWVAPGGSLNKLNILFMKKISRHFSFCCFSGGILWPAFTLPGTGFIGFYSQTALEDIRGRIIRCMPLSTSGKRNLLSAHS